MHHLALDFEEQLSELSLLVFQEFFTVASLHGAGWGESSTAGVYGLYSQGRVLLQRFARRMVGERVRMH